MEDQPSIRGVKIGFNLARQNFKLESESEDRCRRSHDYGHGQSR